jgi:glucokinase
MQPKFIISIDLGGTKILTALINAKNEIKARIKVPTVIDKGKEALVASIAQSVKQIMAENEISERDVKAVCLGTPGTVNPYTGIIGSAPNLGIKNYNIKEALLNHISIPVLVENDVNLAGLGIKKMEMKDQINNMLVVFIGTGIGSALFFDGKIYRGSSFYAGEIGHIRVDAKGNLSTSKQSTTFELSSARPAIVKAIKKDLRKGKKSILSEYKSPKKALKSKGLAAALQKGDPLVTKYIAKSADTIGTVLGSMTTFLNLDTIVIGGGVIEAMHAYMMPRIKSSFKSSVLTEPGRGVKIFATKLGDDAALYGGVALAEEFLS